MPINPLNRFREDAMKSFLKCTESIKFVIILLVKYSITREESFSFGDVEMTYKSRPKMQAIC
jgi:hypothetical protein